MVWRYIVYIRINYGVEIHRVHMYTLCLQVNNNMVTMLIVGVMLKKFDMHRICTYVQ